MNNVVSFPSFGLDITVNPIAFKVGNFEVHWYGVIIATGFLLALIYAFVNAKKYKVNADRMVDVILVSTIFAIIGARTYYVVFNLSEFPDFPSMLNITSGGLAIYGGVIVAFLVGLLMCKIRKVNALAMFDIASLGFLIGQCIGRWGNFVNVEAFGCPTDLPWGMSSTSITTYLLKNGYEANAFTTVHPCFLYESLWCLVGFVILNALSKKRKFNGEIFLGYAAWYGLGRSVIEGLRTDSLYIGSTSLRVSQVFAIICVVAAVVAFIIISIKVKKANAEGRIIPVLSLDWTTEYQINDTFEKVNDTRAKLDMEPAKSQVVEYINSLADHGCDQTTVEDKAENNEDKKASVNPYDVVESTEQDSVEPTEPDKAEPTEDVTEQDKAVEELETSTEQDDAEKAENVALTQEEKDKLLKKLPQLEKHLKKLEKVYLVDNNIKIEEAYESMFNVDDDNSSDESNADQNSDVASDDTQDTDEVSKEETSSTEEKQD